MLTKLDERIHHRTVNQGKLCPAKDMAMRAYAVTDLLIERVRQRGTEKNNSVKKSPDALLAPYVMDQRQQGEEGRDRPRDGGEVEYGEAVLLKFIYEMFI